MMHGTVVGRQAKINVPFHLPNQPDFALEFVIDTGFEGALTLPPAAIATLGLPYFQEIFANLADDSNVKVDVYKATILWQGAAVEVAVIATGKRPLLGTVLLNGFKLEAEFNDGGPVTIKQP